MTATEMEIRDRIVAFAANVGAPATPPEDKAKRRGWLDAEGAPTDDGRDLLKNLGDQGQTRTVFRGV